MAYSIKSVFKGASIYTFGQLLTKASGFFLIPLYTRFLTPEDYGIVGFLQVFSQIMATVLMFGFYGAQTRYFYEFKENTKKIGEFLFSINCYLIVILLPSCVLLSIWGKYPYKLLSIKNVDFYPYLPLIIWTVFFQILNQMLISYYLAAKEYKKCAFLQILQFLGTTSSVIFFVVYCQQGALGQIKGIFWGQVIFFVFFYWNYASKFIFKFSFHYVQICLAFGIPVVFHLLAAALHNSIDRIILEKYVTIDELGIYTLGYQLGMVMSVIVTSINGAWQPNYFELMSSDSSHKAYENRRMFALWISGISLICLIGILWAKEFLILLTPENFHAAAGVVPIILFGYLFLGIYYFAVSPLFQFKKTKNLPFLTGAAALLNIGLNLVFIPEYGIYGAAYTTVVSFLFQAGFVYMVGRKLFDPGYELGRIAFLICLLMGILLINNHIPVSVYGEFLKVGILLIYAGLTFLLFGLYTKPLVRKFWA